jgi:acid stress chaperone HdeB
MKAMLAAAVLAVSLAGAGPASAQKVDLSTVKCKEFLASSKDNIGLILMWMTGYFADQDASPIIDFDKMKEDAAKIGEYCGQNPENGLITAAEEIFVQKPRPETARHTKAAPCCGHQGGLIVRIRVVIDV